MVRGCFADNDHENGKCIKQLDNDNWEININLDPIQYKLDLETLVQI